MVTSKLLRRLATHPMDMARFQTTGKFPTGTRPEGPLVALLSAISPRDRCAILGTTVDERLGYTGSRRFHTAEEAFRWVHPSEEVFDASYADSWRDKRFSTRLYIEDLLSCSAKHPDGMAESYPRLRRPRTAQQST